MDDQNNTNSKEAKNSYINGKAISVEADRKLKDIRKKINDGSFKPSYSEREIISVALMEFPVHLIEVLKSKRVSGKDFVMLEIKENYQEYLNGGGTLDFNSYLKKEIVPILETQRKKKSKSVKVKQHSSKNTKQGGQNDKVSYVF
ncbi:MAG: hypothetical protein KDD33_06265 [Bdellovibrionales bacterium]|nr:hypothetical protein [Bdellovibrionales bacterium]